MSGELLGFNECITDEAKEEEYEQSLIERTALKFSSCLFRKCVNYFILKHALISFCLNRSYQASKDFPRSPEIL